MAWYGGGSWGFRPYVSVATKRALAARALAKLTKKNGRKPEPIVIVNRRRQIATTFWGKAWCDNLERYADFANRLVHKYPLLTERSITRRFTKCWLERRRIGIGTERSGFELIGPLDDGGHVRPLPVRPDPPHALIGRVHGRPPPVTADHEAANDGGAGRNPV